jgi:hypothetical protein
MAVAAYTVVSDAGNDGLVTATDAATATASSRITLFLFIRTSPFVYRVLPTRNKEKIYPCRRFHHPPPRSIFVDLSRDVHVLQGRRRTQKKAAASV